MLKGSIYTVTAIVLSQIVFKLLNYWRQPRQKKSENESRNQHEINEAYFFPDKDVACRTHFLGESRCFKVNCRYSHGTTSLSELYRYLNSCRKTMDVCVYVMTSVDLSSIVLAMHKRGVSVRVITDDEQEKIAGSQIWSLRKAGMLNSCMCGTAKYAKENGMIIVALIYIYEKERYVQQNTTEGLSSIVSDNASQHCTDTIRNVY